MRIAIIEPTQARAQNVSLGAIGCEESVRQLNLTIFTTFIQ